MASRPRIVVVWSPSSESRHWSAEADAALADFAERVDVHVTPTESPSEIGRRVDHALADADGLVFCGWGSLGIGYLSAERLARAARLRFIGSTCHYRQAEFIDVATANARGIAMCETAPIMSPWVAEYEFALGLAALRMIPQEHAVVGGGGWVADFLNDGPWPDRLYGRRVGLASFGETHRHLARFLAPFDVEMQVFDPYVPKETVSALGGTRVDDLTAMARRSEILFVATPPNPTTIGLISRSVIEALPAGAVFVLVSRMAVVEQAPLLERLVRGDLRAAIDVFEPEPPPLDSPYRRLPNLIHTPHRAGNTRGAHNGVFLAQCLEAQRFFRGEALRYPLRPEMVALFRSPVAVRS